MSLSKLTVRANPFAAFDHNGNLAGAVACDAVDHVPYADPKSGIREKNRSWEPRRFVGATIDNEKTIVRPQDVKNADALPNGDQDTIWKFSDAEVDLPVTPYYKMCIRTGGLIAANLETALECGITEEGYLEPRAALEEAKQALIAEWNTHYPDAETPEWARPAVALVKQTKEEPKEAPLAIVKQLKKASA